VLRSHQLGWETCLQIGISREFVQTKVCRTQDDVLTTGEQWKAAMVEKGLAVNPNDASRLVTERWNAAMINTNRRNASPEPAEGGLCTQSLAGGHLHRAHRYLGTTTGLSRQLPPRGACAVAGVTQPFEKWS
jgi:hypothetical protein